MESLTSISSLLFAPISHQKRLTSPVAVVFYSNFTIFSVQSQKKTCFHSGCKTVCVCVSELVSEKRGVSASANQRATPRALANQRLLSAARERRVCFWASHVQSCYSRSTNTFFSRSILTTPPNLRLLTSANSKTPISIWIGCFSFCCG